jgi:DNA (cytosine-5)-methyltransferase 1
MAQTHLTAISLFSSGGLGDLALRKAGFDILVSNEMLEDRHAVFGFNFPNTSVITGDIWQHIEQIEDETRKQLNGRGLTLFYATPPCQGMSKNGRGKLLNEIRAGNKAPLDERNRLIIPAMTLARRLRPEIVLLENVPEMANTSILNDDGALVRIVDFVNQQLGPDYVGRDEVVEFADYGAPQCRQRLVTIFARKQNLVDWFGDYGTFIPPRTHSPNGMDNTAKWITVRDVLEGLPHLDAKNTESAKSNIPYHRVPLLDPMKYWWVENTPEERSAFDNQCVRCGHEGNQTHLARHDKNGINRTSRETPLYCQECGEMLPRPSVERGGKRELMRGFTSAYKRMSYDKPASALTRNLSYACSDNKLHPGQNRVLSLHEAFIIHTLDRYDYKWQRADGKRVSDKTIREIIGESIPPGGIQAIIDHIISIYCNQTSRAAMAGPLFASYC